MRPSPDGVDAVRQVTLHQLCGQSEHEIERQTEVPADIHP